jgi:hypothetical protein
MATNVEELNEGEIPRRYLVEYIRLFVFVGLLVPLMAVSPGCASTAKPMESRGLAARRQTCTAVT